MNERRERRRRLCPFCLDENAAESVLCPDCETLAQRATKRYSTQASSRRSVTDNQQGSIDVLTIEGIRQ